MCGSTGLCDAKRRVLLTCWLRPSFWTAGCAAACRAGERPRASRAATLITAKIRPTRATCPPHDKARSAAAHAHRVHGSTHHPLHSCAAAAQPRAEQAMARQLAPSSGSLHRLLASRHYPPASQAPPLRPLLLPKPLSAAMQLPQRGRRGVVAAAAAAAPAPSSPGTEVAEGPAWGKVSAVLFDMDGVLCNSEEPSRQAAVDVFAEMGVSVSVDDFVPFMGTGEANFLGGVARVKEVKDFNPETAKKRFFEIYLEKYAKPNSGIGFPGALELIMECKNAGLKVAVASSADRIKVDANLAAASLPVSLFDAIVSADAFENLKPAPDIFLAASKTLGVDTSECIVIEDALAGVQAAKAAEMRCIAVTTTLEEDALKQGGPSLIRKNIGDVSIKDILYGDSNACHNEGAESSENSSYIGNVSPESMNGATNGGASDTKSSPISKNEGHDCLLSIIYVVKKSCRLLGSRREILRYGSLGIAFSCFFVTIRNWKAMQFASPKGLLNFFMGGDSSIFVNNEGGSLSSRSQQIKKYLADFESGGSATYVPEFPRKLDWLNTAPLQFGRRRKWRALLGLERRRRLERKRRLLLLLEKGRRRLRRLGLRRQDVRSPTSPGGGGGCSGGGGGDLKGKVVLLDFWTYCCINCMHVLPDLEFVEKKYKDKPFAVVGVHSAKFDNEKDLDAIRNAVLRYNITHPVVNDGDMYLWRELGVNSWPTFVLIGPNGKVLAQISGEGHRKDLDDVVGAALEFYEEKNLLRNDPLPLALEKDKDSRLLASPLKFPGKLAVDVQNNRLFISDSNHNRIVSSFLVTNLEGKFICQVGSSDEGLLDGPFDAALFNRPQGLAYNSKRNVLYVADTENHALRSTNTSFAQPSGISLAPELQELFVADSESSSVRAVNLKTGGSKLLAGGDPVFPENLFRIKRLDSVTRKVTTIAGTGHAGFKDGFGLSAQLSEPAGLVVIGEGRLLVADTNNNAIRYITLSEKGADVKTLDLIGVQPPSPKPKTLKRLRRRLSVDTDVLNVDGGSSMEGFLSLAITVPDGYHFSKEARSKFDVETEPANAIEIEPANGFLNSEGLASLKFKRISSSPSMGRINCKVYYCKEDEVCLYQSVAFDVKFNGGAADADPSAAQIALSYSVTPRDNSTGMQLITPTKNANV
nr:unnamed protein product [Digitaria exilis]